MIKVGLTGGIGSGKTLVSRIFEVMGIPVYRADDRAGYLMENDSRIINTLSNSFGEKIYKDGKINRKQLAEIIFHDDKALQKVNSLVHPIVREDFHRWMQRHSDANYVIEEAAILIESGVYKELDVIVTVSAPVELRIQRVLDRNATTREDVLTRIMNQLTDEERHQKADEVILNDGKHMVIPQVIRIHKKILSK